MSIGGPAVRRSSKCGARPGTGSEPEEDEADDATTWKLIHGERARKAETLDGLTAEQWAQPSLCSGWSVRVTAAHIVNGAEQTPGHFFGRMVTNGFRSTP